MTSHQYQRGTAEKIPTYQCRIEAFETSFFRWNIIEWKKIDLSIQNSSCSVFIKHLLNEIRQKGDPVLITSKITSIHCSHLAWKLNEHPISVCSKTDTF